MSSQVSHDAFRTIFPKYAELLSEGSLPGNESIQTFLREELPRKVELVRNMQSSFNAFLTHFTNAILKRPQHSHLIHSLILKASDKIQKYFHHLSLITHKIDHQELKERLPRLDLQYLKKQFKSKLQNTQNLLRDKYFGGAYIERQCQQQIGMRLYVLFELYHFLKGDPVTIAGKFKLRQQDVLWTVSKNQQPNDIADLINLDTSFLNQLQDTVQKRCRPFTNKRDLLQSKVREILREGESKVGTNMNLLLQSLISKQRMRISRELGNSLGRQFRQISQVQGERQAKQMIAEVEIIKREFAQLKNTTYFLDIMRGSFSQKYKMEVNRLQNVFYLTNLQKFLQDVSTFLQKVLSLQERLIQNRRQYMRDFANAIQIKISDLIDSYGSKSQSINLSQIISNQFDLLQSALYGVVSKQQPPSKVQYNSYQKNDREQERKKQMQIKAQQQREKRQSERIKAQQRRRKDQQRLQQAKQEREEKQRRRREENQRLQVQKRAQMQRKRQEKAKKDQQLRRQRQQEQMKREQLQKGKKQELSKKRQQEEQKKKRERQEQLRKRDEQKKKLLQKEEQQKRKRQAELKERRRIEEEQKSKRQKQRKLQEQKIKREKQQRQAEQKKKQQERLRLQKQKRQNQMKSTEQRKKQEQRLKKQKQQRQKQQKEAQQRKKQQQRIRLQKQKRQRQSKQAEEREKRERERREKEAQQKKRQEERLKVQKEKKQKKAEEQRIARQKEQKSKRQQEQKLRQEKQKKERQQKQKRQRQQRQKRQKEQNQKKQKLQRQKKQKEQKQKKQKEEKQRKEKIERQRKQKQQKERKERQEKQKKQRQQKQRFQKQKRQRQERQRRQRQQKQRLQKEKIEKQRIQKQKKLKQQKQAQQKRRKQQQQRQKKQQQLAKNKKIQPKKSSGINYGQFDDDDLVEDDLEEIKNAGKGKGKPLANQDQADQYIDDFDQQSPEKPGQIETKQLIGPNDIKCLNDYMKGTTYARKNKVNAELMNKSSLYLMLFQQHVQNRKLFIFQSAISKAILDLGQELIDPNTNEQDLRMSVDTIRQQMLKLYDQMFQGQEMHLNTRYIFPISFKNPFNLRVIELVPAHAYFQIVFQQQLPEDEQIQNSFQGAIEALLHIFEIEGQPRVEDVVVSQESKLVLQTFDKQLPCLLILFARHYEQASAKQMLINQYTIERFFYTTHPIEHLYQAMKDGQQIDQFYGKLMDKYVANDKIKICSVQVSSGDQQYGEKLTHSALGIKEEFKKSRHQSFLACFSIELQDENGEVEDKVAVYMSIDRASPKPAINYFLVSKDAEEQDNASLIFQLISEGDEDFEVNIFTDFTRHNCLSSYTDWTLPLWAHSTIKRKLSTLQAMRAMSFAMTPYYLAFKEMD